MARDLHDALTRRRALCTTAAGLVLALVLPMLVGTATEGGVAGVALVALAVSVLVASRRLHVVHVARVAFVRAEGPSVPDVRRDGHITDPPHHPVRPRAPGMR
jgi:hypothetical protein